MDSSLLKDEKKGVVEYDRASFFKAKVFYLGNPKKKIFQ